jgi:predicted esterase
MNRFFMRFDDGSFDEAAIRQNADELAEFLWVASGEYGFDADNVYAVGFSNGANAAGSMLLLHPESLAGVIAFGTTKSFVDTPFGKKKPDLSGKRVWIANGAVDGYSPPDKTAEMIAEFEGLGAKVTLMVHPDGHVIAPSHVQRIHSELA